MVGLLSRPRPFNEDVLPQICMNCKCLVALPKQNKDYYCRTCDIKADNNNIGLNKTGVCHKCHVSHLLRQNKLSNRCNELEARAESSENNPIIAAASNMVSKSGITDPSLISRDGTKNNDSIIKKLDKKLVL